MNAEAHLMAAGKTSVAGGSRMYTRARFNHFCYRFRGVARVKIKWSRRWFVACERVSFILREGASVGGIYRVIWIKTVGKFGF